MVTITTQNRLVKDLFELEVSTSVFLEAWKGMKLQVKIDSQKEKTEDGRCVIERIALLFFNTPSNPVLYCISTLYKDALTADEYRLLYEKELPLGKLFMRLNGANAITKRNIAVRKETDTHIAHYLNVRNHHLYAKKYDYWIDTRRMGQIIEFFNEDSLLRL